LDPVAMEEHLLRLERCDPRWNYFIATYLVGGDSLGLGQPTKKVH